ncbi:interleukin-7 receptor subunit alpha [Sebastes fasciatus]|uniref:interleukin-7 receptor subunit alpha n=1 Tax=Sebastes fasciatus TaxID=394691 RepID=UPI003D9E7614
MMSGCWSAALLLLLLAGGTRAQSGDGDMESRISCTSHILTTESSLSCQLVGGHNANEDDEDYDADGIKNMTVCYDRRQERKCLEVLGDTVTSSELYPFLQCTVIVHLKRGGRITTTVNLMKIVKPRSPQVKNVTFDQESNQAVIRIQIPYHKEHLTLDNQLFQLQIWAAAGSKTFGPPIQNISSDTLKIDLQRLHKRTQYHVRVRALPVRGLQGTWSEWSETFRFFTPAGETEEERTDDGRETYTLMVCLVVLLAVPSCLLFFWKYKIFSYVWPSIPHPKHTLVHICNPNKSLLLNLKPEEFSALKVDKSEPCDEPSITADAAAVDPSAPPCSRSTTSVSTEELELSALLSGSSSSDGEDGFRGAGTSSPVQILRLGERPRTPQPEGGGGGPEAEAEAYVTMSSFYQIK